MSFFVDRTTFPVEDRVEILIKIWPRVSHLMYKYTCAVIVSVFVTHFCVQNYFVVKILQIEILISLLRKKSRTFDSTGKMLYGMYMAMHYYYTSIIYIFVCMYIERRMFIMHTQCISHSFTRSSSWTCYRIHHISPSFLMVLVVLIFILYRKYVWSIFNEFFMMNLKVFNSISAFSAI